MLMIAIAITALVSLVGLIWLSRHFMIWRERRTGFLLTADYPGPPDSVPLISVVVAAKDEAE
ncbi:MAG: hypothetical protein KAU28_02670, partial [Phycisphaerae bacterium]|nr:hypothetical protein [Phycisphaerae bacterium]